MHNNHISTAVYIVVRTQRGTILYLMHKLLFWVWVYFVPLSCMFVKSCIRCKLWQNLNIIAPCNENIFSNGRISLWSSVVSVHAYYRGLLCNCCTSVRRLRPPRPWLRARWTSPRDNCGRSIPSLRYYGNRSKTSSIRPLWLLSHLWSLARK